MKGTLPFVLAVLLLGALAAECVMFVASDEEAVIFRFGAVDRTAGAGLAFRLPRPIEHDERVGRTEVQRVALARRRQITGDTNLVDVELVAQYTVSDPVAHVMGLAHPRAVVASEVGAAVTAAISGMEVDALLTTGRAELERQVRETAQVRLDALGAGVHLAAVEVRDLAPPPAVVDAFNDISSARGDKETAALAADAYASKAIPDARGQAASMVEDARTHASEVIARAQREAERFRVLAEQDALSSRSTRLTLYDELLHEVGGKAEVIAAPAGSRVVLPLEGGKAR